MENVWVKLFQLRRLKFPPPTWCNHTSATLSVRVKPYLEMDIGAPKHTVHHITIVSSISKETKYLAFCIQIFLPIAISRPAHHILLWIFWSSDSALLQVLKWWKSCFTSLIFCTIKRTMHRTKVCELYRWKKPPDWSFYSFNFLLNVAMSSSLFLMDPIRTTLMWWFSQKHLYWYCWARKETATSLHSKAGFIAGTVH